MSPPVPSPHWGRLVNLQSAGCHSDAQRLLDALNHIQVAFGGETYVMPAVPLTGTVTPRHKVGSPDETKD